MKIVIDISDDLKDKICNATEDWAYNYVEGWGLTIARIIRNGTPLPKGHGDLIDKKETISLIAEGKENKAYFGTVNKDWEVIDFLNTITPTIEADKVEQE